MSEKKFTKYSSVGKILVDGYGWNVPVPDNENLWCFEAAEKIAKDICTKGERDDVTVCILAHIASSIKRNNHNFADIYNYLKWIDSQYATFVSTREARHGKCPTIIKSAIRAYMRYEYARPESHYFRDVKSGKLKIIDGHPRYYGKLEIACIESQIKRMPRYLTTKAKDAYDKWMKTQIKVKQTTGKR